MTFGDRNATPNFQQKVEILVFNFVYATTFFNLSLMSLLTCQRICRQLLIVLYCMCPKWDSWRPHLVDGITALPVILCQANNYIRLYFALKGKEITDVSVTTGNKDII